MPLFDLKALENDFKQESVKQSFDGLYQCLGFITAIASSPDQVKPSEWIKQLMTCEDKSPQFESEAQAHERANNFAANPKYHHAHFFKSKYHEQNKSLKLVLVSTSSK